MERANGLILSGIKPRLVEPLERSASCWLEELPAVLWSLGMTPNKSTGFMPFFLIYGAEAVIPTDIKFDSPRVTMYTEEEAEEARQDGVDLLEEAGCWHSAGPASTNRVCVDTTTGRSGQDLSKRATLCSD